MKKILSSAAFCIVLLAQIACDRAPSKPEEVKPQTTKTSEPKTQAKTEETKIGADEIKNAYPTLKAQADAMGAAFSSKDYDRFTDFMYPKLVEMSGGREKFVSTLNSSLNQAGSTGFELISYEVGEPSQALEIDNQVFAVLPTKTTMKFPQRTAIDEGSIIAVSDDKGRNWKFVRVKSKESIRPLFPKAIDKLTFPEHSVK